MVGGWLAPASIYWVEAGGMRLPFTTGSGPDMTAPALTAPAVDTDGRCVRVQVAADEPVTLELRDGRGAPLVRRDVAALVADLAVPYPPGPVLIVMATDLAGNLAGNQAAWQPPAGGPSPLVISEVMAHPRGRQPAQEWVELKNLGRAAVSTAGLQIASGGGSDPLPDALVPAGGYAVIVGAGFSEQDGVDVPPAPDAAIVRLANATIGGGLGNPAGGAVELRAADGRLLSRYGGFVDVSAHSAAGQSAARIDPAGCDVRANWQRSAQPTPGAGP